MFQYPISKLPNDRFLFWWQQDFYVLTSHSEGSSQVAMLDTCHSRRSWHCIQQVALPSAPAKRGRMRKGAWPFGKYRKIIQFTQYSCSVLHWEARCYRSFCKLVCLVVNFVDFLLQLWPWNCIIRDHSYIYIYIYYTILYNIIHSSFMRFHFAL